MKKKIWMSIAVLLIMGGAAFAQENEDNSLGIFGFQIKKGTSWAAFGYQMNVTNVGEGSEWTVGHGLKILGRFSMLPINENINFGFLFSGRFSFPQEADWISPDTGDARRITNADFILDFGAILGATLHGRITGPIGFGIGAGLAANFVTAKMDTFHTLLHGEVDLDFNVFDLGLALNAGLKFDVSRFVIEVGTDISYSFFKSNSYTYTSEYLGIVEAESISGGASIIRISPYILFGVRF